MVQCQIDKTTNISRSTAIEKKEKEPTRRVPMMVTCHPDLLPLNEILRNQLPTIYVSEKM